MLVLKDIELHKCLDDVTDSCAICLKFKKVKPKPIVGFPLAKYFNETNIIVLGSITI